MIEAVGLPTEGLRWLIQSASDTGRRTDLRGNGLDALWPVEEVRGGIALGDHGFSDVMIDNAFLWNVLCGVLKITTEPKIGWSKSEAVSIKIGFLHALGKGCSDPKPSRRLGLPRWL
jgi:hypothetical protein